MDKGVARPDTEPVLPTYRHLLSSNFEPHNPLRVIAHCDVDAAYAQFEAVRLGIDCHTVPLAVLQWTSMIAVNYVARAYGVDRFQCTLEEARKRCPDLQFIHVASYGPGDEEPQYYPNPSSNTHKISLDLYRRESKKILDIFQHRLAGGQGDGRHIGFDLAPVVADGWAPLWLPLEEDSVDTDIIVEKASIDESFFDLSVYVRKELLRRFPFLDVRTALENMTQEEKREQLDCVLPPLPLAVKQELVTKAWMLLGAWMPGTEEARVDEAQWDDLTWVDVAYSIAAERMIAVRKHVVDRLQYTTSAGIAPNKALAKLASGHRKPCSQTVILPRYVLDFLGPLPFRKIRFLGGKLGAEVLKAVGQVHVEDLWRISLAEMQERFGASGKWLYDTVRGIDFSEVTRRVTNRSMMSAKNFQPHLTSNAKAQHWLSIMSSELSTRLQDEREACPLLYPRSIVLRYLVAGTSAQKSQQLPFGFIANDDLCKEIYHRAQKLWMQSVGLAMEKAGGAERVGVCTLSLSFAGLERQSRDQRQLDAFFQASKRKQVVEGGNDTAKSRKMLAKAKERARHTVSEPPKTETPPPATESSSGPVAPSPYAYVTDAETQTSLVQWICGRCQDLVSVPVFKDSDDETNAAQPRSYERILDQQKLEHEHWHMAVDMASGW